MVVVVLRRKPVLSLDFSYHHQDSSYMPIIAQLSFITLMNLNKGKPGKIKADSSSDVGPSKKKLKTTEPQGRTTRSTRSRK